MSQSGLVRGTVTEAQPPAGATLGINRIPWANDDLPEPPLPSLAYSTMSAS